MARTYPYREEKLTLARQMLRDGASSYAVNKECKRLYRSGLGYSDILEIQADLDRQAARRAAAVTPIELPAEVMEAEEVHEDTSLTVPSPVPNGTTVHLKAIQSWMGKIQAEQIILTKDGKLSVLAWHQFDLGGPHD